jgi:hypothetical protein
MASYEMADMNKGKSTSRNSEGTFELPDVSAKSDNQTSAVQVWAFIVAFWLVLRYLIC